MEEGVLDTQKHQKKAQLDAERLQDRLKLAKKK